MIAQQPNNTRRFGDLALPDRYVVHSEIGHGSYGSVYEALDKETGRLVAIKRVHHVFEDLVDCKRILREIALLTRMKHDNVVKILDICIPRDLNRFDELFIVLEIADSDFKKLFRTDVFLTEVHVRTLLYNMLIGLRYVHSQGILHRDIKPANCLVNQDCSVKICDFGLARTVDGDNSALNPPNPNSNNRNVKRRLTGHVVTRWYRAPELILLQENYNESIDVWSVGCIFGEMLNMIKENVPYIRDRAPLFPGYSCFPLSPDQKNATNYRFHTRDNRDQLNMIFNLLGTPAPEDLEFLEKDDARRYVKVFQARPAVHFSQRFPFASTQAVDLLTKMLAFNPNRRINIDQALHHPFFKDVRNVKSEQMPNSKVRLPFNDWQNLDEEQLRFCFVQEIRKFHPEVTAPLAPSGFQYDISA